MGKYIIKRLLFSVLVVFAVSIAVFLITHVIGNPVDVMLPLQATEAERDALTRQLGFDKPVLEQLRTFLWQAIRLDFGNSWYQNIPCSQIIAERMQRSLELIGVAFAIAALVAIPLGIVAAYKQESILDRALTTTSLIGVSLPEFWFGLMLILFFALRLDLFPTSGYGSLQHIILPASTLSILPAGHLAQVVRFSMQEQISAPYTTTALAKGVSDTNVLFHHNLRNAMTSALTIFGHDLGSSLAGHTSAVEIVFGWPGFGMMLVDTINQQDFPLLQASVFVVAVIISLINLIIDIFYAALDPRIRY